jgi:hypothetical protein
VHAAFSLHRHARACPGTSAPEPALELQALESDAAESSLRPVFQAGWHTLEALMRGPRSLGWGCDMLGRRRSGFSTLARSLPLGSNFTLN